MPDDVKKLIKDALRAQEADESWDEKLGKIRDAFYAEFEGAALQVPQAPHIYVDEVRDEGVIAKMGEHTYLVPFTVDDEGNVEFGEPEKVEKEVTYKTVEATDADKKAQKARASKYSMKKLISDALRAQEADESLDEKLRRIRDAFYARFSSPSRELAVGDVWVEEIYDDHVITKVGEHTYRVPYTVDDEGNVEFGEPEKVEKDVTYRPVEATDADKKAQKARASKYGIGIKKGGNVTKPSKYEDCPEGKFADSVNFRYPCVPADRAQAAVGYFNQRKNQAAGGYTDEEWGKMGRRIAKANGEGYSYDADSKTIVTPSTRKKESVAIRTRRAVEKKKDLEGKVWEVTIIRAGLSMNGNYYPAEVLEADETIAIFEGVQVFDNHLSDEEWQDRRGHRNVNAEYMGWIDNVHYVNESLKGQFHVADMVLREKMKTVFEGGRKDEFGFSIDAGVEAEKRTMDGKEVNYVMKFLARDSVDVVFDPSAGGQMERMLESNNEQDRQLSKKEVNAMTREELLEALKGMSAEERATFLQEFVKGMGDEERAVFLKEFMPEGTGDQTPPEGTGDQTPPEGTGDQTPPEGTGDQTPPEGTGDQTPPEGTGDIQALMMEKAQEKLDAIDLKLFQVELKESLVDSALPKVAREFLWDQFNGRIFDMKDIHRAIETQRNVLASVSDAGQVKGMGGIRISAGPVVEVSGFQLALERMLGTATEEEAKKAPKIFGIREWYQALTQDYDWLGQVAPHRVTEANVTTATVTSIVKNVLNKRVLQLYESAVAKRWWEPIVTHYPEETINQVTVYQTYGIAGLDTVVEGATYTEKTWGDYEETATFYKKGNFIGVTLESFMRDNLNALRRLPDALQRSWLYTIQTDISYLFTQNSGEGINLGTTSRNWFNSTNELNLLTTALDYTAFDTAQNALFQMAEAGSSEPLGIYGKWLLVPPELRGMAIQIRDSEKDPDTANNAVNTWRNQFEVIVVPKWTDADNWYLLADPSDAPLIGLHSFRGQRTPELFQAESDVTGSMFTNDVMRWKIRWFRAVSVADHLGAHGNVV